MRAIGPLLLACLAWSKPVFAANDCYDPRPVAEFREVWAAPESSSTQFFLPSHSAFGTFLTPALASFRWDDTFRIQFQYDLPNGQVGIPYTVHRVEIVIGNYVRNLDFTGGCNGPGLSFFPRQNVELPAIKLPPELLQGGPHPLSIRVWGHL